MLSETTLGFLSTLTYRADARRLASWLPLSGIYWEDEMPDIHFLHKIPESDRIQIIRMFGIRVRMWNGQDLSDTQEQLWDATYSKVPQWAFFRRIHISDDDLRAQENAQEGGDFVLEVLLTDADEVIVTKNDGVESISATVDLTKNGIIPEKKHTWWERVFRKRRGAEE